MTDSQPLPELFCSHDSDEVSVLNLCGLEIAVYSHAAPLKETPNEDAAAVIPVDSNTAVLSVADGCGGLRGGDQASSLAIASLVESVRAESDGRLRERILDGFEEGNKRITELSIGAATTIAVTEFRSGTLRPYHVGDSEMLVIGRNGKIKWHTIAHSPVGYAFESGLIDEQQAIFHEGRHLIANVLGDPEMRIEIGPSLELARHDTVVIASDGLFDNLFAAEIADTIRKGDLSTVTSSLVESARFRMLADVPNQPHKPDDLTVIVARQE